MNDTTLALETADLQTIFPYAKQSFFTRVYELYPASNFNSTFFQRAQIYGDYIIDCRKKAWFYECVEPQLTMSGSNVLHGHCRKRLGPSSVQARLRRRHRTARRRQSLPLGSAIL